jgi:DNA-binding XRE family transcriptional regulator
VAVDAAGEADRVEVWSWTRLEYPIYEVLQFGYAVADVAVAREAFRMALTPRDLQELRRIGDTIVAERNRHRMTQEDVADASEVSLSTVQRMEEGRTDTGMSKYLRVARAIGVPAERIVGSGEPGH